MLSNCYVTFGTLFQDGDSRQYYRQKAAIMAVLAGVGWLRHEAEGLSGYSRAVARPCFRASMRLSKVDLVQLASRWEGLAARRSSAARVAVAVEESDALSRGGCGCTGLRALAQCCCGLRVRRRLNFVAAHWNRGFGRNCAQAPPGAEGALQQAENIFGSLFDEELVDLFALEFEADQQAARPIAN